MTREEQLLPNVAKLEATRTQSAHPERTKLIRDWHQSQAYSAHEPVACLNFSITDCGQVKSTGLAIEPEHALIFLGELESVSRRLRSFIEAGRVSVDPGGDILPFVRRA